MPREYEAYRDNLAALIEHFGRNHNLLSPTDVARYCGRDPRTVIKYFGIPKHGITIHTRARKLCK